MNCKSKVILIKILCYAKHVSRNHDTVKKTEIKRSTDRKYKIGNNCEIECYKMPAFNFTLPSS